MIVIGIDIGLTGAIGFVDSHETCVIEDMPTVPDGEKKRIDGRGFANIMLAHWRVGEPALVLIEDVRPRSVGNSGEQTNSMHSQGSMMRSRGVLEGVLDMLRLKPKVVQPQTWKRFYGLIKAEKSDSLATAKALYPSIEHQLKRLKDHNRAESLLIAHYGLKKLT